jgi:adenylate cyclase
VLTFGAAPQWVAPALRDRFQRMVWPLAALLAAYTAYEVAMRLWLARLLHAGRAVPGPARRLQVFVEVSLPTLALLIGATVIGPLQALTSAMPYVYFLFIFVTALSLDDRLCAFAGLVAGAEFAVLSLVFLRLPSGSEAGLAAQAPMLVSPHQYVVKAILLALSGLLTAFVARSIRHQMEVALRTVEERDRAVSIFGQHVSPQVAEMLLQQPIPVAGEERGVCVMFLDIRDFSRIAADRSPAEVMGYLNQLFGFMIPVVNQHQGIVNKFLGDGFMAVFGAPLDDGDQCRHALDSALAILAGVEGLSQSGAIPPTRLGIGLHMGQAVTGNVGSCDRKEYTVIGDVVNLAARIEQATKQFGAQLIVSATVWEKVAPLCRYQAEDLGLAELKGQAKPTRLYKLA